MVLIDRVHQFAALLLASHSQSSKQIKLLGNRVKLLSVKLVDGCRIKGNCSHVGPGPVGGECTPWGLSEGSLPVFTRDFLLGFEALKPFL